MKDLKLKHLFSRASTPQVMGYSFGLMALILAGVSGWIEQTADGVSADIAQLQQIGVQAERTANKMSFDVVQVQQFITDAALTHAKESIDEADAALMDFNLQADKLSKLLGQGNRLLGEAEPKAEITMIKGMQAAVADLFVVGKVMVDSYWSEGQEKGNAVMGAFDQSAEKISSGPVQAIKRLQTRSQALLHDKMALIEKLIIGESVILTLVLLVVFFTVRSALRNRLTPMINVMQSWEGESMEGRITHIRTSGQTGDLSWALNDFGDRAEAFIRDLTASLGAQATAKGDRRMDLRGLSPEFRRSADMINGALDHMTRAKAASDSDRVLTQGFEQDVRELVEKLSNAGAQMRSQVEAVASLAAGSSSQAVGASDGTSQASNNVETVAAAAEELSASISEVSRQVNEA
ncbi:MAG: hypothetical protein R8J85_09880, partial [Mariprofundales bacterium]